MAKLIVDFEVKGRVEMPAYSQTEIEAERLVGLAYERPDDFLLEEAEFDTENVQITDIDWK